jgi:hypothetical protein
MFRQNRSRCFGGPAAPSAGKQRVLAGATASLAPRGRLSRGAAMTAPQAFHSATGRHARLEFARPTPHFGRLAVAGSATADSGRRTRCTPQSARRIALRGMRSGYSWRARGPLLVVTAFRYAGRASLRLLGVHSSFRRKQLMQMKRARHKGVAVRRYGVDSDAARAALLLAKRSVSDWQADRDVRFRHSVSNAIDDGRLRAQPKRHGTRSRTTRTVGRPVVPEL